MIARKWGAPQKEGNAIWQYWIDSKLAIFPRYIQGQLVGPFQRYWITWPVDQNGNVISMYRSEHPTNPGNGPT